ALFLERVPALLCLLAHVEEHRRIAGELLHTGGTIADGVDGALEHAQCQRGLVQHLTGPGDGFLLQFLQGHHGVDQPHVQRFLGAVLTAQVPDLAGLLQPNGLGEQPGTISTVEGTDLRSGLTEFGVVRSDGQVTADVQHMAAAHAPTRDHGDDGLGSAAALYLQVEDVESADALLAHGVVPEVAIPTTDLPVTTGAARLVPGAGEDDHTDFGVVPGDVERRLEFEERLGAEGVVPLGTVDRDLGNPLRGLVDDVGILSRPLPIDHAAHGYCCSLRGLRKGGTRTRTGRMRPSAHFMHSASRIDTPRYAPGLNLRCSCVLVAGIP